MDPIDVVTEALVRAGSTLRGTAARCPAHDDEHASLSVNVGEDGRVLIHCHGPCETEDVLVALGLTMSDLFPAKESPDDEILTLYVYETTPPMRVVRTLGKKFYQQHQDRDGRWIKGGVPPQDRVPYRLSELTHAVAERVTVFVVEGEKDADTLCGLGLAATTNPMGANYWPPEWGRTYLSGAWVVVLGDNDDAGRARVFDVVRSVLPHAAEVRAVELPGLPEKGDVTDWVIAGHGVHDLLVLVGLTPPVDGAPDDPGIPKMTVTLGELMSGDEPDHDWLIDGLLERRDRVITTGPEGQGKSTLLRQMGLGAAIGENSLSSSWISSHEPRVVLLIDLENSRAQLRREFEKLVGSLDGAVNGAMDRFHLVSRPDGLVLDDPKDRDGDRAWVEQIVEETRAELVILGPIYKMLGGDPNDELPNRDAAKWIDRLRMRLGFTILLEAHTPHGQQRPYGWSGWKRWPEFGFHLHEDGRLEHFRGQREEREWPRKLIRSSDQIVDSSRSQKWLWIPDLGTGAGNDMGRPHDRHKDLIATCKVEVLNHLNSIDRALTKAELVDLVGRRKAIVVAAIAQLREDGALVVETVQVMRSNGSPYSAEGFRTSLGRKATW
jgi:AAA domain